MDVKFIDQFIKKNSSGATKSKSNYIYPKLVSNSNDFFEFSCLGSSPKPYNITIELGTNKVKATSCTCPFNYSGICKHTVASLKELQKGIKSGEILILEGTFLPPSQQFQDLNKLKGNQIPMNYPEAEPRGIALLEK